LATSTNIDRLKALRQFAAGLRGAEARWREQYSDRKYYDKQGFGFTLQRDTCWNAFTVPAMGFEAYVGTYGSSSCGRAWSADQALVNAYFVKALNQHKQAILDSMADLAEAEADALKDAAAAEIDALRALLDSAQVSA
jgi:hypothetical protein